ncbi:MAG: hypothetical protein AABY22_32805 [Nanoarchaeota archaeon]
MINSKEALIKKIRNVSNIYHNLSLLFYELSRSLEIQSKTKSFKELKEIVKGFDFERLEKFHINNLGDLRRR